jgi:hypothetical protein
MAANENIVETNEIRCPSLVRNKKHVEKDKKKSSHLTPILYGAGWWSPQHRWMFRSVFVCVRVCAFCPVDNRSKRGEADWRNGPERNDIGRVKLDGYQKNSHTLRHCPWHSFAGDSNQVVNNVHEIITFVSFIMKV